MTEEEERAHVAEEIRQWRMATYVAEFGAETEALIGRVVRLRAEAFEAGRKESTAEWVEGAAALSGTCKDLSIKCSDLVCEAARQQQIAVCSEMELRALKAKLARVEAVADAALAHGAECRADDYGDLYECLRIALEDK